MKISGSGVGSATFLDERATSPIGYYGIAYDWEGKMVNVVMRNSACAARVETLQTMMHMAATRTEGAA